MSPAARTGSLSLKRCTYGATLLKIAKTRSSSRVAVSWNGSYPFG